MLSPTVLQYGSDEPLPRQIALRAGPLSLLYENGDLRYIALGQQEIVRRIYVAVRDPNWDTILPVFSNEEMDIGANSFHITYTATHQQGTIDFVWQGDIRGESDGTVTFSMDGRARSTFQRNRIGFCILHPAAIAGAPCRIEHVDGTQTESQFPLHISPHQPFMEMRAIAHEVTPGAWARVAFDGDVFEMEDQRNWTDASYKTYCTPLAQPFPVTVEVGTRIRQTVTLTLEGQVAVPSDISSATDETVTFAVNSSGQTSSHPVPELGLGIASHGQPLDEQSIERLRALHLSHLRADVQLSSPACKEELQRAVAEARALDVGLEVALFLSDDTENELADLLSWLHKEKPPVRRWLIFHENEKSTSAQSVTRARTHLREYDATIPIGAGTNAYFTELNRERPDVSALDFVTYSINPQVHAFDNASLIETLAAQATTVTSARQFVGDTPLIISPVTLRPRFNPNATGPEPEPEPSTLPPQVDVRQMSLFGAGWTLGSLKYLGESGVRSITYYETTGWRGVMETENGSPLPAQFQSLPGGVYPLYHVLADVGDFADGEFVSTTSSHPLRVDGMALRRGESTRVLVANLSPQPQSVEVTGLAPSVRVRVLDETNATEAMQSPEDFSMQPGLQTATTDGTLALILLPYAVVRIDL